MKKIDLLVLRAAVGPFLATFFIANVVFLMQMIYLKIDDIMGKGLDWDIMSQLLLYASFTIVPITLPLAVLVSSIMTLGNLGEHNELVAMKSAGVPLTRSIFSLTLLSIVLGIVVFFFSNTVMPYSKLKFNNIIYDIRQKKSVLLIKENVFINDFDQMTMKVDRKSKKDDMLYGVTIYDHRNSGSTRVIKADSAKLIESPNSEYMTLHLMDGKMHEDKASKEAYTRFGFTDLDLIIDMSSFEMGKTDEGLFKHNASLKSLSDISKDKDSLEKVLLRKEDQILDMASNRFKLLQYIEKGDSIPKSTSANSYKNRIISNPELPYTNAIGRMETIVNQMKGHTTGAQRLKRNVIDHKIAWYQKFSLALSCVILFFIGASMGAIVRKGGFGIPVITSILFYLFYYVIDMVGKNLAEEAVLTPLLGMWLSSLVLIPVAFMLTRMAVLERKINLNPLTQIFNRKKESVTA